MKIEHRYCEPVAEALAKDVDFVRFFMTRAGVGAWASKFRCLWQDQAENRGAKYWWKHVYCHEAHCQCANLRGGEIDILAVFERSDGKRLGLYIECKYPAEGKRRGDIFKPGQAARYRERLSCWTLPGKGPRTIPRHEEAVAILICGRVNAHAAEDIAHFDGVIFFDEIAKFISVYPAP